jgi:hypothetical protein
MAQKVNPISLRCPSPHKTYTDCWYSDSFYTKLQLKKLKLAKHLQGLLNQKGLPEGQVSLTAGSKVHRYLLCTLDPTESRTHKSLRYRVRPQKTENLRNIIRESIKTHNNVFDSQCVNKARIMSKQEPAQTKKAKIVHNSLIAALVNTNKVDQYNELSKNYTQNIVESVQPQHPTKGSIFNHFGAEYNNVASNMEMWTSSWESHHADFIAQEIAYALTRRVPFRSIKLQLIQELEENTNAAWGSVRGIRVTCAGRGNRKSKKAQRAQTIRFQWGQTSLHVFSEKVGFASRPALTSFGKIGIKAWVCYK